MTPTPASPAELHRLLSALADGKLSDADEKQLSEFLQIDPAARAEYYEHIILAALLRREGRRAAAQRDEVDTSTHREVALPSPTPAAKNSPPWRARPWLMALAASVLLALFLSVSEATGVTELVPTIIRIVTGEGSLVIEVDDPGVSVTLDGEDITISGAGIHELKLRPGTHKFVATKDGQPAHSEIVTIHKGQRKVVSVRLEPTGPARPDQRISTLVGHTGPVWSVAFTPNGRKIVSTSLDGTARVWDLATGREIARFAGGEQCTYDAAISPDGARVLSGGGSPGTKEPDAGKWSLCLWELETGSELKRLDGESDGITSISLSSDGRQALIGCFSGKVKLWDVEAWREIKSISTTPCQWHAAWSAEQNRIVTAAGFSIAKGIEYRGGLQLWNLADGQEIQRLRGHDKGMWQAVFSPNGQQIASTGADFSIALWNAETGTLERRIPLPDIPTGLVYSPDGSYLLTGNYGSGPTVRLWNLATKKEVAAFSGHSNGVQGVAISRDGQWAASGSHDCTIRLWKLPAEVHTTQVGSK
jgi:WD40 repeat protein